MTDIGLSDFFGLTPDLVWIAGDDGFLKKVNPAVIEKLGYTEEELYSRPVTSFIHPDDVAITLLNRERLLRGEVLHNFCNRYISRSGEIIWLEWTSIYIPGKENVLAIAKDITARKKLEAEIGSRYAEIQKAASHFKNRIENDRKYFAYELHEELAQLASVVNMDAGWLNINASGMPEKVKDKIEHISVVCKLMIKTIQRLAFSISPQMLDSLGLNITMEWFCKEFSVLNGISCSFESDYDEDSLTQEMKIDFFRICQDALNEMLNLSEAEAIRISIKEKSGQIELCIHDRGNGFSTGSEKQAEGLKDIEIRANSISGVVALQKSSGGGNSITVVIKKQRIEQPARFA